MSAPRGRVRLPASPTLMLDAALSYADRGWQVFPIYPPAFTIVRGTVQVSCSCRDGVDCKTGPGKHPRTLWRKGDGSRLGRQPATADKTIVRAWWKAWPDANIGIATGAVSGIIVVDVDDKDGGWDTLAELERTVGFNRATLRVIAPGNGAHFYFAHPGGHVPCSASKVGRGVDIRGDRGMAVAPPSVSRKLDRYRWYHDLHPDATRELADA
jgi:putative DNA primase/helicase